MAGTKAVWPVDPASGGTWIGANEAGIAMVLLNRTPGAGSPRVFPVLAAHSGSLLIGGFAPRWGRRRSRGTIIPDLLRRRRIESALEAAGNLPACDFEPFTLLVLHGIHIGVLANTGKRMSLTTDVLSRPILFTSSSLGDHTVIEPRRALFARMVERRPEPLNLDGQAAFHRHRWRSRPSISVLMSRPDAATVSRTMLDVDSRAVRMRYAPISLMQPS